MYYRVHVANLATMCKGEFYIDAMVFQDELP
jgi:hypothetical protein